MTTSLALKGIRKSFDGVVVLDDAEFSGKAGEVHALLGENGAGKSSLMNVAAGLYAPARRSRCPAPPRRALTASAWCTSISSW